MMLAVQKEQEFRLTLKAEKLARPSIGRGALTQLKQKEEFPENT
jgi:hypothetical protein